jgi:hypothetical protein
MEEILRFEKSNRKRSKAEVLEKVLDNHNYNFGIGDITQGVSRGLGKLTGGMIGTTPKELQGLGGTPSAVEFYD